MISRREGLSALGLAMATPALMASPAAAQPGEAGTWTAVWGAAVQKQANPPTLTNQTVRQKVIASAAGRRVRVRFSNEWGSSPLKIGAASVKLGDVIRPLTFSGSPSAQVSPGAPLVSDAVDLAVPALAALEISLFLPGPTVVETFQRAPQPKGAVISPPGDFTGRADMPMASESAHVFLSAVEVTGARKGGLLIYSDTKSAGPGTWPEMLVALEKGAYPIVNRSMFAGLLTLGPPGDSALARFDRDVLACAGASHVLIFTGNNDLIQPGALGGNGRVMMDPALALSETQLMAALAQAVARARAAGLKAIGGTWLPYEGVEIEGYAAPEKLRKRDAINAWIRTRGNFDAVIDFDAAVRDPARPQRLLAAFDSGNKFTPNEAGYRAMAAAAQTALKRIL